MAKYLVIVESPAKVKTIKKKQINGHASNSTLENLVKMEFVIKSSEHEKVLQ